MINVKYSNQVTNDIRHFRETVYCTDEFMENFKNNLKKEVNAIDTIFTPDQFGGWIVHTTVNRNKCIEEGIKNQTSDSYLSKVTKALSSSIHDIDKKYQYSPDMILNLANVVITGTDSIAIKI